MKLTIVTNEDGTSFASKPLTLEDATNTMMTGLINIAYSVLDTIPEESKQTFKEATYDTFNEIFTAFLESWIPDKELRSDLAAEAILELENQKITEAVLELDASESK